MTANVLPCVEAYGRSATHADEYESLRISIGHQLRRGLFERLDTDHVPGNVEPVPQISGAIFLALQPKQLKFLMEDARVSIVLALQRHLTNEEYRRRLIGEFHYRAFRPHLTESFRLLMVKPSNSDKYRFLESRKPTLALAYQSEMERLEMNTLGRVSSGGGFHWPVIAWKR